jgi:hypothetical protein
MSCTSGSCRLVAEILRPSRFRMRRRELERRATAGPPQDPCGSGRHVQKELRLKPARRTVARLDLEARELSGDSLSRRVEGHPVDGLNAAVRAYRRNRQASAELRFALLPSCRALADDIEKWLAREVEARRDVFVRAHLVGGRAVWTFTPWRCVRGRWRRRRAWKVEVDDERALSAAVLTHPYPVAVSAEVLLSQLITFVAEVDVTKPQLPTAQTAVQQR